jgi:hypothetical protein
MNHWNGSQSDGLTSSGSEGLSSRRNDSTSKVEAPDLAEETDETDGNSTEASDQPGFLTLGSLNCEMEVNIILQLESLDDYSSSFGPRLLSIFAKVTPPADADISLSDSLIIPEMTTEDEQVEIIFEMLPSQGRLGCVCHQPRI